MFSGEPSRASFSTASLLEASIVTTGKGNEGERLATLVRDAELEIAVFGNRSDRRSRGIPPVRQKLGPPGKLNFGDCFSYALAKSRNFPLLFKGDDFVHTDIVAWKPA